MIWRPLLSANALAAVVPALAGELDYGPSLPALRRHEEGGMDWGIAIGLWVMVACCVAGYARGRVDERKRSISSGLDAAIQDEMDHGPGSIMKEEG